MTLTSSAWRDGGEIPPPYTQAGEDMSPPLQWTGAPEGVVSYALVVHDVDAAAGNGTEDLLHWLVWNIPAAVTSFHEHSPSMSQLPDGTRQISASGPQYRGPGAAATGPLHHYTFEVYALDAKIDVAASTAAQPVTAALETRAAVMKAMQGHVLGKAVYVGLFRRPQ